MKVIVNFQGLTQVKLSGYGAILYNDYLTKGMTQEETLEYYSSNRAVKKGDTIEGSFAYVLKVLKLGTECHGLNAIHEDFEGNIVFLGN